MHESHRDGTRGLARAGLLAAALGGLVLSPSCAQQEFHSLERYSPPETFRSPGATSSRPGRPARADDGWEEERPAPRIILDSHVLLARADAQLAAGKKLQAVRTLEQVLDELDEERVDAGGGSTPASSSAMSSRRLPSRASVEERIRQLDFERHDGAWIPKDSLLSSYAWRFEKGRWHPPDSRRLCNMLGALIDVDRSLRELPAGFYDALASQHRITRGMNRREVVQAWGYFEDISVVSSLSSAEKYEELVFASGTRRVYLRRGHVLFWIDTRPEGEER